MGTGKGTEASALPDRWRAAHLAALLNRQIKDQLSDQAADMPATLQTELEACSGSVGVAATAGIDFPALPIAIGPEAMGTLIDMRALMHTLGLELEFSATAAGAIHC